MSAVVSHRDRADAKVGRCGGCGAWARDGLCPTCSAPAKKRTRPIVTCLDCRQHREHQGRGLCPTCWQRRRRAGTLDARPTQTPPAPPAKPRREKKSSNSLPIDLTCLAPADAAKTRRAAIVLAAAAMRAGQPAAVREIAAMLGAVA